MIIRELKSEDVASVELIYDLYWSGEFRKNLSRRLNTFVAHDPEIIDQGFRYYVSEENGKICGVLGFRKAPEHMKKFTRTVNPTEIYIFAVKQRMVGVGRKMFDEAFKEIILLGYSEIIIFSGETHQESWGFYDNLGLERVPIEAIAPDGEKGQVWRKTLQ